MLRMLLLLAVSTSVCAFDDMEEFDRLMSEPQDRSRWVDPMDMGMPQKNRGQHEHCSGLVKCGQDLAVCRKALEKLAKEQNSSNSNKEMKPPVTVSTATDVFLKRHVSYLLSRLGLSSHSSPAHLKVEVLLSEHMVDTLENFVSPRPRTKVHAVDVVDILSNIVLSVDTYERNPRLDNLKELLTSLRDPLFSILAIFLIISFLYSLYRILPPSRLALLVLVFCLCWHWLHLFKMTWAAKHSKLLQSGNVPPECRPKEMTWLQTLQSSTRAMFSSVDRCEEYHKTIMVDPIYEINPLTALVDLLTKLLLHPLSSLGSEVGLMFSSLLEPIPWFWKVPVLLVFVLLLMFCMILLAGYKLRLPFFMGELSPAQSNTTALTQQIQELKQLLADGRKQSQAILDLHSLPVAALPSSSSSQSEGDSQQGSVVQALDFVDGSKENLKEEPMKELDNKTDKFCIRSTSLPETPKKTVSLLRKASVTLTPVKNRVLEDPTVIMKQHNLVTENDEEGLDLRKNNDAEGGDSDEGLEFVMEQTEEEGVLDLRTQVTSPQKTLIVMGNPASPATTSFDWVGGTEEVSDGIGRPRCAYLEKVEEVFQRPLVVEEPKDLSSNENEES